jgi:hypothetical protein
MDSQTVELMSLQMGSIPIKVINVMDPMNLEKMSNVSLGDIPQCKSEFIGRLM